MQSSGREFVEQPDPSSAMTSTTSTAEFPTVPGSYSVLSSGRASRLTEPNDSGSSGDGFGASSPERGDTAYDVTVLRVDLDVPAGNNCLVGLDFRFLSEEYPEYVGSRFNDAFIAELDRSTWTTSGSEIVAPDNFAFDPDGNPITINTVGSLSMGEEFSTGTTFDGGTPSLTAATPITPGRHSLFLSIFDQGDDAYDSAVLLDNLRLGQVADGSCTPGRSWPVVTTSRSATRSPPASATARTTRAPTRTTARTTASARRRRSARSSPRSSTTSSTTSRASTGSSRPARAA